MKYTSEDLAKAIAIIEHFDGRVIQNNVCDDTLWGVERGGKFIPLVQVPLSEYEELKMKKGTCVIPPEGWYCTRDFGHDGPCAAISKITVNGVMVDGQWEPMISIPISDYEELKEIQAMYEGLCK